jgi:fido (protein-threonine AMPylation protein)
MSWQTVYSALGITPADERLHRVMIIHERIITVCSIADASDMIEFERLTPAHCRVMKTAIDWSEAGYSPRPYDILDLHRRLFPLGGHWRAGDVLIKGSDYRPPRADFVPLLMQQYCDKMIYCLSKGGGFETAAQLHLGFLRIHPFTDGNGRIGRMLLNHNALWLGLPFIKIAPEERDRYLDALEAADVPALAALLRECAMP